MIRTANMHEDCILGVYNTSYEIIHIKTDFINITMLFLNFCG